MATRSRRPVALAAAAGALAAAALTGGCAGLSTPGRLLTFTVQPHSTDFHNTPVGHKRCMLDEHSFKEPLTGRGITVEWSLERIRTEAQRAGITNIAYTELQTLSVMMGTYTRRRLIVYGD